MSTMSSSGQVLVRLDKISVQRKTSHSLCQWLAELEESKLEDLSNNWKQKYLDLEKTHKKATNTYKWLRERITELENSLSQHKSEVENAVAERDDTLRKLKHTRKVIRDLLVERGDMQSPRMEPVLSQDEIDAALNGTEFVRAKSPPEPSTPTSIISTVRRHSLAPSPTLPSTSPSASPPRSIPHSFDPDRMVAISSSKRGMRSNQSPSPSPSASNSAAKKLSKLFPPSPQSSRPSPALSTSSLNSEPELCLHYNIPSSYQVIMGPYSKEKLHQDLDLNISDVDALSRITSAPTLGLNFYVTQSAGGDTMAFIYSPAFLEGSAPGRVDCRLIEWGRTQDIQRAKTYIASKIGNHSDEIHTFTFPTTNRGKRVSPGWYYLGAMKWQDADRDLEPPDEERVKITHEMYYRLKKTYSKEELSGMMERRELEPFGVVLKKIGGDSAARNFLRQHDGLNAVSPAVPLARVGMSY